MPSDYGLESQDIFRLIRRQHPESNASPNMVTYLKRLPAAVQSYLQHITSIGKEDATPMAGYEQSRQRRKHR